MKIKLQYVHYMPNDLEASILYVSREFGAAAHLCACGCNTKIRTPLGPTEWSLEESNDGPSLSPSIGNWQQACQSHYWIERGEIRWSGKWSAEQIIEGRNSEASRRHSYYNKLSDNHSVLLRAWSWLKKIFGK